MHGQNICYNCRPSNWLGAQIKNAKNKSQIKESNNQFGAWLQDNPLIFV